MLKHHTLLQISLRLPHITHKLVMPYDWECLMCTEKLMISQLYQSFFMVLAL